MCKLDLEKAEEPEIKLPPFVGSQRKQGNYRKTFTSASLTKLKPLTVCIKKKKKKKWKILKGMKIPDYRNFPEKPAYESRTNSQNLTWTNELVQKLGKECDRAVHCYPEYLTFMQSTSCEGFPDSLVCKDSAYNAGYPSSIPQLGRSLEKGWSTHSSILDWRIPWILQSFGLQSRT